MNDVLHSGNVNVDSSMEMASMREKNTEMVRDNVKEKPFTFSKRSVMQEHSSSTYKKIADGTDEETINHKEGAEVALPHASVYEDGDLRRRGGLREPGASWVCLLKQYKARKTLI